MTDHAVRGAALGDVNLNMRIDQRGPVGVQGVARLGRRTKDLVTRLGCANPGAVLVIDHGNLDAVAGRALADCAPAAVINVCRFVDGRYANRGPGILVDAGVPLYEAAAGCDLFSSMTDGAMVRVGLDGHMWVNNESAPLTRLSLLDEHALRDRLSAARLRSDTTMREFAANTLRYLSRSEERSAGWDRVCVPTLKTVLRDRHVLVIARSDGCENDLRSLSRYVSNQRPAVIAVDGAADLAIRCGVRPDIIIGDMDSVANASLRSGAELVVHAYPSDDPALSVAARSDEDGTAPGLSRLRAMGLDATLFPVRGTSEDAALLLAYEAGADLVVAVGTHNTLEDFLDKDRDGMASTFLVRLKLGRRLVDVRGLSRLGVLDPSGRRPDMEEPGHPGPTNRHSCDIDGP